MKKILSSHITNIYYELRRENKYFDLCLLVDDKPIYCHKLIVCENSELVEMLLRREFDFVHEAIDRPTALVMNFNQQKIWPPINTIKLTLPDNINFDAIDNAINFL